MIDTSGAAFDSSTKASQIDTTTNGSWGTDDTIQFDTNLFSTAQTITLNGVLGTTLDLNDASKVTINGPSVGLTIRGGGDGSDFSVFTVAAGSTATLINLTITDGSATTGGGIYNNGNLIANGCAFTNNDATILGVGGGAIFTTPHQAR